MTLSVTPSDEARNSEIAALKARMSKKVVYLMRRRIVAPEFLDG